MNKYTKVVLAVVALSVLALPVKADEIIDCGGTLYRLERNLFSTNTVSYREAGKWKKWCDASKQIFEAGDDAGRCISSSFYAQKNGKFELVEGEGEHLSVIDFLRKTYKSAFPWEYRAHNLSQRCYTFKKL